MAMPIDLGVRVKVRVGVRVGVSVMVKDTNFAYEIQRARVSHEGLDAWYMTVDGGQHER